jgi:hypothetical protein
MFFGTQTFEEADMDLRQRLTLRLQARTLDRALADGASPDRNEQLARRAQALVRADTRNEIAASLRRIAQRNGHSPLSCRVGTAPARCEEIRADIERVATRLLEPGPVAARGVALTQELLTDGAGPLFWTESADDLGAHLRFVLEALEIPASNPRISDPQPDTEGSPR